MRWFSRSSCRSTYERKIEIRLQQSPTRTRSPGSNSSRLVPGGIRRSVGLEDRDDPMVELGEALEHV